MIEIVAGQPVVQHFCYMHVRKLLGSFPLPPPEGEAAQLKCDACNEPAKYHMTEIFAGTPVVQHFCDTHIRELLDYRSQTPIEGDAALEGKTASGGNDASEGAASQLKCQACDEPAKLHVTEIVAGKPVVHHFCHTHAGDHLVSCPERESAQLKSQASDKPAKSRVPGKTVVQDFYNTHASEIGRVSPPLVDAVQPASWSLREKLAAYGILDEAEEDARAGRHAAALAKYIRFHALPHCPSFALGLWHDLAEVYPPAMDALRLARDRAESRCLESAFDVSSFRDLKALNRTLGEQSRTVEIFKVADRTNRNAASRIYPDAEPSLILQKEYGLCGKYLEPKKQIEDMIRLYEMIRKIESERSETGEPRPKIAGDFFMTKATTLVALLVKNNRIDEAKWVCTTAQSTLDDESFKEKLVSALGGNFPPPWLWQ